MADREPDNREEALGSFCSALASLVPCDVVCVLDVGGDDPVLHIRPVRPVRRSLIAACEHEMMARRRNLSGASERRETIRVHVAGDAVTAEEGCAPFCDVLAVPLDTQAGGHGLLAAFTVRPAAFAPRDGVFFAHAARHLTHVLRTIRTLEEHTRRDPLTGLYNRRGFQDEFQKRWLDCRQRRSPISLAIVDIDNFKQLNDAHGHLLGDEVLKEFVGLAGNTVRTTDVLARFGGDEFAVILPHTEATDALAFAERLLQASVAHIFRASGNGSHTITISIGVASTHGDERASMASLLARADQALLDAKRLGRNRVCIGSEDAAALPAPGAAAPRDRAAAHDARGAVLVVDDEPVVASMIQLALRRADFTVETRSSAAQALAAIVEHPGVFDVVLADVNLPGKNGFELIDELRARDSTLMHIVITGDSTMENALYALRRGVFDFLQKPLRIPQLTSVVANAVEFRRLRMENARYQTDLEEMVKVKSAALQQALDQLRGAHNFTLDAMASMLDAREPGVGQHSLRVRDLAVILAQAMGLSPSEVEEVARGALLHDLGKICVPDAILLKAGPLTDEERIIMQSHAEVGYRLLRSSPYLKQAAAIVHQHQERFDGTGYPQRLKGDQICYGARIFAVVDAYDAMRSPRPYRQSLSREHATREVVSQRGSQFDPEVVDAFLDCIDAFERFGSWDLPDAVTVAAALPVAAP